MSTDVATTEQQLSDVDRESAAIAERATALEVRTPQEAEQATELLSRIAKAKRKSEAARKFLVKPLNDHVSAINARFKQTVAPLEEADQRVRAALVSYQAEQERHAREEQARLDKLRREEEERAEAERRKAVEEAQRVEREAHQAEERRQAEIAAEADQRRRDIAAMDDHELEVIAKSAPFGSTEETQMAKEEIASRKTARQAQERAAAAEQAAEEARQREIAAKSAPTAVAVTTPLSSGSGSASTRKRWVAEVLDIEQIPRQYLIVDQAALNAAVRSGVREIPGVEIKQVTSLAVRS